MDVTLVAQYLHCATTLPCLLMVYWDSSRWKTLQWRTSPLSKENVSFDFADWHIWQRAERTSRLRAAIRFVSWSSGAIEKRIWRGCSSRWRASTLFSAWPELLLQVIIHRLARERQAQEATTRKHWSPQYSIGFPRKEKWSSLLYTGTQRSTADSTMNLQDPCFAPLD